ncbi:hypothetical protein V6N12_035809 [Hibiscus sabdariffa]|uniref:RNase H type-1 domain-containing protein n=1 Tax=Hibiscus sabdariffa TaxID=183260 RepID=A0ABR2ENS7_9ROSI
MLVVISLDGVGKIVLCLRFALLMLCISRNIWEEENHNVFLSMPFVEWIRLNLANPQSFGITDSHWAMLFCSILWNLWGSRNRKIFDPDAIDGGNVLERSRRLAMEANRAIESEHLYHRSNSSMRQPSVRWNPPRSGVWKVNVDGAWNLSNESASCGGFIRETRMAYGLLVFLYILANVLLWRLNFGLCMRV